MGQGVLNNDTAGNFTVPSMWVKGIINPILNDNILDPRDPMSYRLWFVPCIKYIVVF